MRPSGALSVALKARYGDQSLAIGAMIGVGLYLVAAVLALLAVRPLKRGWVEESEEGEDVPPPPWQVTGSILLIASLVVWIIDLVLFPSWALTMVGAALTIVGIVLLRRPALA